MLIRQFKQIRDFGGQVGGFDQHRRLDSGSAHLRVNFIWQHVTKQRRLLCAQPVVLQALQIPDMQVRVNC
jgi:hypothetical protein